MDITQIDFWWTWQLKIKTSMTGTEFVDHTEGRKTVIDKEAFREGDKSGKVDPKSLEDLKVIFGDKE
ncbi:hypothetical protein EV424DRAFT_1544655 [Suillus variegatus]|nr:hypothetical protein EV424DRAFT_1544655 [Suillus variegatus]